MRNHEGWQGDKAVEDLLIAAAEFDYSGEPPAHLVTTALNSLTERACAPRTSYARLTASAFTVAGLALVVYVSRHQPPASVRSGDVAALENPHIAIVPSKPKKSPVEVRIVRTETRKSSLAHNASRKQFSARPISARKVAPMWQISVVTSRQSGILVAQKADLPDVSLEASATQSFMVVPIGTEVCYYDLQSNAGEAQFGKLGEPTLKRDVQQNHQEEKQR